MFAHRSRRWRMGRISSHREMWSGTEGWPQAPMRIASWRRRTSSQSSDIMCPVACQRSAPQSSSVHAMSRSRASRARRASAITSGPTPSPGRRAIESAGMARDRRAPAAALESVSADRHVGAAAFHRVDDPALLQLGDRSARDHTAVAHHHQRRVGLLRVARRSGPRRSAAASATSAARPAAPRAAGRRPRRTTRRRRPRWSSRHSERVGDRQTPSSSTTSKLATRSR